MTDEREKTAQPEAVSFTPPLRMHHLSGGVGFLLGQNKLGWIAAPGINPLRPVTLRDLNAVPKLFAPYKKIRVLGRTVYQHADELHDPITDHFVLSATTSEHRCLASNQEHHWSGVSTALHVQERGNEGLLASRVASQIHICTRKLEQLSKAYRTVLSIVGAPTQPDQHKITNDKYAQHIGTEFRSLLNELYGLRDAVNGAVYRLKYGREEGFRTDRFRRAVEDDKSALAKLISQSMFDGDGDKLIERMSLYRSVALHCLGKNNPIFGDGYQQLIASGPLGDIPYLVWPLYDDIERMREIQRGSSRGILGAFSREEAERFLKKEDHLDALEFCFDCFVRLLRIAEQLSSDTALPSRPMIITDDDIIEATFTDEDGNVIRVARDATTGKLVEV